MDTLYSCYKTRFADDMLLHDRPGLACTRIWSYRHYEALLEQMPRSGLISIMRHHTTKENDEPNFRRMGKGGGIEGQAGREKLEWSEEILSFTKAAQRARARARARAKETHSHR